MKGFHAKDVILSRNGAASVAHDVFGECAPSFYAAIPPEEVAISIGAAMIRAQFALDDRKEAKAVVRLFDAIIGLLTGSGHRHWPVLHVCRAVNCTPVPYFFAALSVCRR